jgi:hypothetical protein
MGALKIRTFNISPEWAGKPRSHGKDSLSAYFKGTLGNARESSGLFLLNMHLESPNLILAMAHVNSNDSSQKGLLYDEMMKKILEIDPAAPRIKEDQVAGTFSMQRISPDQVNRGHLLVKFHACSDPSSQFYYDPQRVDLKITVGTIGMRVGDEGWETGFPEKNEPSYASFAFTKSYIPR